MCVLHFSSFCSKFWDHYCNVKWCKLVGIRLQLSLLMFTNIIIESFRNNLLQFVEVVVCLCTCTASTTACDIRVNTFKSDVIQ